MSLISDTDLATLNEARTILKNLERDAAAEAWRAPTNDLNVATPQALGRLAQAADDAEYAIFNTLNTLSSHRAQALTEDVLHNREPETAPA